MRALRWIPAILSVWLLAVVAAGGQDSNDIVLFKSLKPVPTLHTADLGGATIDLAAYRGKVLLVNFWATWCTYCREEIPRLAAIQKAYAGKVQVLGISLDDEGTPPAQVKAAAAKLGVNYPVIIADDKVKNSFGAMPSIPVTYVVGVTGNVEQKHVGSPPAGVFENEVKALLKMPVGAKVVRVDQLSPNGKVATMEIPGVADLLKSLSPAQRDKALARLNDQACTCPCGWSLATCRVTDPECPYSLPDAVQVIKAIKAGK